ncbi:MAG: hypothetical protein KAG28_06155 [Cocleimonas sp.]|nr:hypothetical protein [Cocleimonas sp.]
MGRILIFILFVVSVIAIVFSLRWLWRQFKSTINQAVEKGTKVISNQQQKWRQYERRKKLPKKIQTLIIRYEALLECNQELSKPWQQSLKPTYKSLGDIVHILSVSPKKSKKVRQLFNTSLPTLEKFVTTLKADQQFMTDLEVNTAQENIKVFEKDIKGHEHTLQKSRRFDFDVLMKVIKIRLRKD